jgi:hypothetical protein
MVGNVVEWLILWEIILSVTKHTDFKNYNRYNRYNRNGLPGIVGQFCGKLSDRACCVSG